MSLFRKNETPAKPAGRKLVFSGKRNQGTWIMETTLPVSVRRSGLNQNVVVADNRRVRTLH
jgi:hypothetical protein